MDGITHRARVGISSCLLGEAVRYDGGHKRNVPLLETLGAIFEWVPVCPEVECGFGTPREPMRLVGRLEGTRMITVHTAVDVTDRFESYAARRVDELGSENLSGYVLKKDSPSCGLYRVNVYDASEDVRATGRGLFAARLAARYPSLPLEDEERLADAAIREQFVARVLSYARRSLLAQDHRRVD